MPTLLIRHGHGIRLINNESLEKVPLAVKAGHQHYARFGGFVDLGHSVAWLPSARLERVKINRVYGYSETDGHFDAVYFGLHVVGLGWYCHKSKTVMIPLYDGLPLVWCDLADNPVRVLGHKRNNVTTLSLVQRKDK